MEAHDTSRDVGDASGLVPREVLPHEDTPMAARRQRQTPSPVAIASPEGRCQPYPPEHTAPCGGLSDPPAGP